MNLQYRKKPVVVEAFQMTPEQRKDKWGWPEWLHQAWNKQPSEVGSVFWTGMGLPGDNTIFVNTVEGVMSVAVDDYIIRGVAGELYACKPEIFEQTYEPASQESKAEDFRQRLDAERVELADRFHRLTEFINGVGYHRLPVDQRELLCMQRDAMNLYLTILDRRIALLIRQDAAESP
jgi:hypothetical protein